MKKLFLLLLAVLLIAGTAWAISFPGSEDAEEGPYVWTVPVYNNSGASLSVGTLVVWQFTSSTGDDDNYVTTSTDTDTFLVAGIVYPNAIAATDSGTIAVHGVVDVRVSDNGVAEGSLICSDDTTAGLVDTCSDTATDANAIGFTTTGVTRAGLAKAFLFGR